VLIVGVFDLSANKPGKPMSVDFNQWKIKLRVFAPEWVAQGPVRAMGLIIQVRSEVWRQNTSKINGRT
jgi:hypothetical protein